MHISTSNSSLRFIAVSALLSACAMLSACDHAAVAQNSSAAMPMSVPVAMGPVYFGDTMSFGAEDGADHTTLVANYKPKAPGF